MLAMSSIGANRRQASIDKGSQIAYFVGSLTLTSLTAIKSECILTVRMAPPFGATNKRRSTSKLQAIERVCRSRPKGIERTDVINLSSIEPGHSCSDGG